MTLKERVLTVRIDAELSEAMEAMREEYGTPISYQVRKALEEWLTKHGVLKADRKRAATRKRS
jgi:hypothetical protein